MISIIVPVFNEQNRIKGNLDKILSFAKNYKEPIEIVAVDDGSSDETPKILEDYKIRSGIKVVTHNTNLGKGAAIRTGVNNSTGEKVLFTDIDLSVPIETLDSFSEAMSEDIDIVIGSRENPDSKIETPQSFIRETAGYSFTILTNAVLQVGVSDFTCGFKLFRREAARKIFSHQQIQRWAFDAETMYLAKKYEFKIKEMPVVWRHNEGSKVQFPQALIDSLLGLFQIRLNDFLGKYET